MENAAEVKKTSRWQASRPWRSAFLMILPALAVLIIFYFYPILKLIPKSFIDSEGFTLSYFSRVFTDTLYRETLLRTLRIALLSSVVNLLLGYPVAYMLSRAKARTAGIIMGCILISFWTSLLVRVYSWMVILQKTGLLSKFLVWIGILQEPRSFMYTDFAVLLGMSNILLPYMILPIYSVLKGVDRNLPIAAMSLGATPAIAFWKITLPMSMPGVMSGVLLVFIQSLGFYIIPIMLGGPQVMMITSLIDNQMFKFMNWNFGAALGMILLLITAIFLMGFDRLFGLDQLKQGV